MPINQLSTSNTFQEWLIVTNQLANQQSFFESSIASLSVGSERANTVVVKSSVVNDSFFLVMANTVTGNATNVYATPSIRYNPHTGVLKLISTEYEGTEKIVLPKGNTAQRFSANVSGSIRYNTDNDEFEGYANNWQTIVRESALTTLANDIYSKAELASNASYIYSGTRLISMSETLLSGQVQTTAFTYDTNNEKILIATVTLGSNTRITTYSYNASTNLIESWATVES